WTASDGSSGTGAISRNLTTLVAGTSLTYTITIDIPDTFTGALTTAPSVTSSSYDATPACASCSDTDTQAVSGADISVTKTDNTDFFAPGGTTTYTITVTNYGPDAAQDVVVTDALPAGISAADMSWTGPSVSGTGALLHNAGTLAAGSSLTYTV